MKIALVTGARLATEAPIQLTGQFLYDKKRSGNNYMKMRTSIS